MERTARQAEILRRVLESDRLDLHVALPGRIRSYDRASGTAEVEIQVRRVLPSGDETVADATEDYPILPGVPVLFPRATGSGGYLAIRLAAGDHVWVMFSEADLGQWRATGEVSDPGLATRHGLSGAVAIPGLHHRGNPNADAPAEADVAIGVEGGTAIEVYPGQINVGGSQTLALSSPLGSILNAIVTDLGTLAGLITGLGGVVPPSFPTAATVQSANPIDTSTTRGA